MAIYATATRIAGWYLKLDEVMLCAKGLFTVIYVSKSDGQRGTWGSFVSFTISRRLSGNIGYCPMWPASRTKYSHASRNDGDTF